MTEKPNLCGLVICPFLLLASLWPSAGRAGNDVYIAPYDGQYTVELYKINEPSSGIIDARGTLTYKLSQDCLGWIAETSILIDVVFENGVTKSIISNLSSFESFDGWQYSFASESYNESDDPVTHTGNVAFSLKDNYGTVTFAEPEKQQALQIPIKTLFPVALYKNIIRAANDGIAYFSAPYFDGSSSTELFSTSIFITSLNDTSPKGISGDVFLLNRQKLVKSSIAFFGRKSNDLPQFESRFQIFNNGIMQEMIQTLGPIEVKVSLQELKNLPSPSCSTAN